MTGLVERGIRLLFELHGMIRVGQGHSDAAENFREELDKVHLQMAPWQRVLLADVSGALYDDEATNSQLAAAFARRGEGEKLLLFAVEERGRHDYAMDRAENCPFASIGGLDARHSPQKPKYITESDWGYYQSGYCAQAEKDLGPNWRDVPFGWKPALVINDREKP